MAFALVQQAQSSGAIWADNETVSLPGAATAGNLIVCICYGAEGDSITGIDDAGTTSFSQVLRHTDTNYWVEVWYGIAAGASAGTSVTATSNTGSGFGAAFYIVAEFSGNDSDQSSLVTGTITETQQSTHQVESITPGTAENLLIGVIAGTADGTGYTNDADFTNFASSPYGRGVAAYKIQSSATAQAFTVTNTGGLEDTVGVLVAFKGAAAASHTRTPAAAALALAGIAATVAVSGSFSITPDAGALTLTGTTVTQTLTVPSPAAAELSLSGAAPTVTRTETAAPTVGALVLSGAAPTVTGGDTSSPSIQPDAGSLTLTGDTPSVIFSSPVIIPGSGQLMLSGDVVGVISASSLTLRKQRILRNTRRATLGSWD